MLGAAFRPSALAKKRDRHAPQTLDATLTNTPTNTCTYATEYTRNCGGSDEDRNDASNATWHLLSLPDERAFLIDERLLSDNNAVDPPAQSCRRPSMSRDLEQTRRTRSITGKRQLPLRQNELPNRDRRSSSGRSVLSSAIMVLHARAVRQSDQCQRTR